MYENDAEFATNLQSNMEKKSRTKLNDIDSTAFLLKCDISQDTYQQVKNVSDRLGKDFLAPYNKVQTIKDEILPKNIKGVYRTIFL